MKKNILVIGIGEADETTTFGSAELLVKKLQKHTDDNVVFAHFDDFVFKLYGKEHQIIDSRNNQDIAHYDAVFFRDWFAGGRDDLVLALSVYLKSHKVPFINEEVEKGRSRGKLSQHVLSAIYGVPMPATFCGQSKHIINFAKSSEFFGYPCIAKASNTSRGRDNFLVNNEKELLDAIKEMDHKIILVQEYIPNESDYRILMFESEILMVIERKRPVESNSHLNNTSQGASALSVPITSVPSALLESCAKVSKALGRTFTGVDIIEDSSNPGTYYCLEINNMPQMETGAYVDEKLAIASKVFSRVASRK